MTTIETGRTCIAEEFLKCTIGSANKGYVLRIYKNNPESFEFYTNYGPLATGMNRNHQPPRHFNNEAAIRGEFRRKLTTELGKGYQRCPAHALGLQVELNGVMPVGPASTSAPIEDRTPIWVPHLYTTSNEEHAQNSINDRGIIFQRKYDGERMRLSVTANGAPFSCNRTGFRTELTSDLRTPAARLYEALEEGGFDFDGERIGSSSYVVWDNVVPSPDAPYEERFKSLLQMARSRQLPAQFTIAETAFTPETKAAMLETAKQSGWEGIMIKRRYAPYHAGRSALDWKYPFLANVTVRLTHVNPTATTRFGSVATEIRTGITTTVPGGNVAGGFSRGQLEELAGRLQNGAIILADIRYKNWTGQALYQPKFERYRTDLTWGQCVVTHMRGASQAQIPIVAGV